MSDFNKHHKSTELYLDNASNGNGSEKAAFSLEALRRLRSRGLERAQLVEIGPGGGAALEAMTKAIRLDASRLPETDVTFVELDGVNSNSLERARAAYDDYGISKLIQGDARELPTLIPGGADVVAASAVLHEVYSYGGGYDGIDRTLSAVTDTLNMGGYFAYRDVFSVNNTSQHERTHHIYHRESWVLFAKLFLPHYLKSAVHPYHHEDDKVVYEQDSKKIPLDKAESYKNLVINAPIGVLREFQRHYITLRDYCWRNGTLGVTPELDGEKSNDWLDQKNGRKRVHYKIADGVEDQLLEVMSEESGDGTWVVDGDIFDTASDVALGNFLERVLEGQDDAKEVWEDWLAREGSETYTYMTGGRLLGATALRSLEVSEGRRVLLPEFPEDVRVIDRSYYNRFLAMQLSNPLPDAKQLILFKAMDTKRDKGEIAASLDVVSRHCDRETIARIYRPIKRSVQ